MVKLSGADKYNSDKLPQLEKHVDEQVSKSAPYNLDANLAILRHYQFQPQSAKIDVLAKILMLALSQLPGSDYKICIHLVSEKLQAEDTVSRIMALASALETTRFAEFWTLASGSKDMVGLVPGFEAAVRRYVLHVLGISYQRVTKRVLGDALQLQGGELDNLIKEHVSASGWQVSGDLVTLPKNELNSPVVVKRTQEAIRFDQVAPVLRCVPMAY